ncbi:MAG: ankyrin repeat domain-containing protein [Planctomycetota bacterium]|jgi:ankyrin repeat protein
MSLDRLYSTCRDRRSGIRRSAYAMLVTLSAAALLVGCGQSDSGTAPASESAETASAPVATETPAAAATAQAKATSTPSLTTAANAPATPDGGTNKTIGPASDALSAQRPERTAATPASASASTADRKPGPAFRFEPAVLDMGEMMSDTPKTMSVRLVNVTDAPVKVNRAIPSCGCTTLGAPKDPIAPGAFADIEITLKPGIATGVKLSKKVTFDIDGYAPQVLTVEGDVAEYVSVTPKIMTAPQSPEDPSASESGVLTFASTDGVPFIITGVNPSVVADGIPTESATEHELSVDWALWEEAKRPIRLTFTTSHPKAPTTAVTVKRSVRNPRTPAAPTPSRAEAAPSGLAALIAAARSGDAARIRLELANGTDVDAVDPASSRTALHWAAAEGQLEVAAALLEANADLNALDRVGMGPLAMAAKGGHPEVVTALLDAGANVNMRDAAGGSPLLWASGLGNSATVELLLAKGAEVNIADVNGLSPLLWATSIGRDPRTVDLLLAGGANAEQADRLSGDTPTIRAAKNSEPKVLEMLLARDVDLSKANLRGTTALMAAAGSGGVAQVEMLLAAGADTSAKDSRGWTALDYALNRSDASRDSIVAMLQPSE